MTFSIISGRKFLRIGSRARPSRLAASAAALLLTAVGSLAMPLQAMAQETGSSRIERKTLSNVEKTDHLGLGIQVGSLSGLGIEYWVNNNHTINAAIVGERKNLTLSLSYAWMFKDILVGEFSRFVPFAGVGVIGSSGSRSDVFKRKDNETFALAAQIPVGIEYLPRFYRFSIFAEFAPSLQVASATYSFLTADLGARYYF